MFQDEAGFGRINVPKYCWTGGGRPTVPCHHIREYRYAFGAVDPCSGDHFFYVMPWCNTLCMNIFLDQLSKQYEQEEILLICDGAAWHKSISLNVPANTISLLEHRLLLCQEIVQNKVRKSRQISKEVDAMESVEKERRLFHTSHSETTATGAYAQQPS
jgi:putative transposase